MDTILQYSRKFIFEKRIVACGVFGMLPTVTRELLPRVQEQNVYTSTWVDKEEERADIARDYVQTHRGELGLMSHGFVIQVESLGLVGLAYVRAESCLTNPDSLAARGLQQLMSSIRDLGHIQGLPFQPQEATCSVKYWLHPGTATVHDPS